MPVQPPAYLTHQRYECSWGYFWTGFLDWWAERCDPSSPSSNDASRRSASKPLWAVALVAWGLVIGLGLVLAMLGPTLARGMSFVGTELVAKASMALTAALVLGALVAAPVWVGLRVSRFLKAMCLRGWELQTGQRKRYGAR